MPHLIFAQSPEDSFRLAGWAQDHLPIMHGPFGPCQAIGVAASRDPDAELWAVLVYHDYSAHCSTMQCSIASITPRWCTKTVIKWLLYYPFMQLQLNKIWGIIEHTNTRSIDFHRRLGFRQDATLRHQFGPDRHAVFVSMLKKEYLKSRWFMFPPNLEQQRRAA